MEKFRLTTEDNPFNPFTQWDDWYSYDLQNGYYTCERLARMSPIPKHLPEEIYESDIEDAADQMIFEGAFCKNGLFVKYIKVINPEINKEK